MKIAIATDENQNISQHFGRTEFFTIYEVENNKIKSKKVIENKFTGHKLGLESKHNVDHHSVLLKKLKDCEVIISGGMGPGIYNALKSVGKKVYITDELNPEGAVKLFLKGELKNHEYKQCSHKSCR